MNRLEQLHECLGDSTPDDVIKEIEDLFCIYLDLEIAGDTEDRRKKSQAVKMLKALFLIINEDLIKFQKEKSSS